MWSAKCQVSVKCGLGVVKGRVWTVKCKVSSVEYRVSSVKCGA